VKILFLCHRIPFPPDKGDKIRSFNELVYLSKQHEIHLATILDRESDNEYIKTLGKYCKRVFAVRFNRKIRLLKSLISGKPFSISNFYCRDLQEFVDETLGKNNIDAVICYCSSMAEYIFNNLKYRNKQLKNLKLIMDFVDLDSDKWLQFSRYASFPANLIYRLENKRLLRYEVEVNKRFDHSIFVSDREVDAFKEFQPIGPNVHVIPNGVDYSYFSPGKREYPSLTIDSEPVIVFTGVMDYFANEDGVRWFCERIFSKIRSCFRKAQFYIVGNRPTNRVRRLSSIPGVHVTGYVEDIRKYYWMADICVTPLRIARGLQNKVLEAMSTGNTVVASSNASEGIICHKDQDIIIADDEESFSQAVIDLLQDGDRRRDLGLRAMENIRQNYSWDRNLAKFDQILGPGLK
jgi:polysaccharide biosynthesis protein PslH